MLIKEKGINRGDGKIGFFFFWVVVEFLWVVLVKYIIFYLF